LILWPSTCTCMHAILGCTSTTCCPSLFPTYAHRSILYPDPSLFCSELGNQYKLHLSILSLVFFFPYRSSDTPRTSQLAPQPSRANRRLLVLARRESVYNTYSAGDVGTIFPILPVRYRLSQLPIKPQACAPGSSFPPHAATQKP
jgi:hypothetical protein